MNKKCVKRTVVLAFVLLACLLLSACGTPAPSGMFHPLDTEKYVSGVENFAFSVPEDFDVTMSSNMLAAVKDKTSFTVQTRHSDYYYKGGLKENYKELKEQLTALYGEYTEKETADLTVAGQAALRVEYELTVAGQHCGYIQYLFYNGTTAFYLFTYSFEPGKADEALLKSVLDTVTFDTKSPIIPEGFKAVENATAKSLSSDRYLLYCPDEWVFDNSLGQICMRVPSSSIISNISLNEVKLSSSFAEYADSYAGDVAPDLDLSEVEDPMERYILATLYSMTEALPEMKIGTIAATEEGTEDDGIPEHQQIAKEDLLSKKGAVIQTKTSKQKQLFYYVDFSAKLSDHTDHGSGGLFGTPSTEEEKDELPTARYCFRQCFIVKDGYLYFFTYTASPDQFSVQLEDFDKVIDNFEFIEKAEK
ncbi:MAG: hypothetical protein IJY89_01600 [Clostridia bacterium]|nr:hypothetical protein [Clostridia bacterium]